MSLDHFIQSSRADAAERRLRDLQDWVREWMRARAEADAIRAAYRAYVSCLPDNGARSEGSWRLSYAFIDLLCYADEYALACEVMVRGRLHR